MSVLVPWIHRGDFSDLMLPSQLFGLRLGADDLLPSFNYPPTRQLVQNTSQILSDPNKFQVMLDMKQFTPDDISVKIVDKYVVIEGKHEEKLDEHGFVSRQFQRRYLLPEDVELENVSSSLSYDGILSIEAPKKKLKSSNERIIPIQRTQTTPEQEDK